MSRIRLYKYRILLPLFFILFVLIYLCFYRERVSNITEKVILKKSVENNIKKGDLFYKKRASHLACIQPNVENKIEAEDYISTNDNLICNGEEDWVIVKGYEAIISKKVIKEKGKVTCLFTELIRVDDYQTKEGQTISTSSTFIFSSSDFYAVSCSAENDETWKSTLVGIRRDEALRLERGWNSVPDDGVKHNVLMLGFDSLSHNSFIRTLPKTYKFLFQELKTNVLDGYNIVGDGTPQALIPILTGNTELELPETRKRMGKEAHFVNIYPFIWKNFANNGYVTLYAEDEPHEGIFSYRLKGFDKPPTDHYMRSFYTYMYPYYWHSNYCFYSTPRHKVFFKYLTDFFDSYDDKPKFGIAMHAELSHNDQNLIGIADEDLLHSLTYLKDQGYLSNTILIVFSDHGNRFSAMRASQQGKQEERLPFFSIYLPPDFRENYPSAADNVRVNTGRLTSPFDIYATLKDLTHFTGAKLGKVSDRAISLFSEIPPSRTCQDAFIEAHWCACLTWDPIPVTDDKVIEAAKSLIHYINTYTSPHRGLCHEIKLLSISWAALLLPNEGLLNFKRTADYDGFLPEFSDQMIITEEVYQISISAVPTKDYFYTSNDFPSFEASLTYNTKQDSFSVKIDDISRINKYGDQPHCIINNFPHLRKFCYCLEPPK